MLYNSFIIDDRRQLKKLRESKGLTQQDKADLMHTHRTGYFKMENNQQDIPVDKLVFVAKHLGLP